MAHWLGWLGLLVACGGSTGDTGSVGAGTAAGTTSSVTCTCRPATVSITVERDGALTVPDRLEVLEGGEGTGAGFVCGDTDSCLESSYTFDYSGQACAVEARLASAVQTLRCEDHLEPQQDCVCGRDAMLSFAFDSATTP